MNHRVIRRIGIAAIGLHALTAVICLFTLLFLSNGAAVVIALFVEVPFLMIMLAGDWMIGRIRILPFLYFLLPSFMLLYVYWHLIPQQAATSMAICIIGTIACVFAMSIGAASLFCPVCFAAKKQIVIAGIVGVALLVVVAVVFLILLSLLFPAGGGVSPIPDVLK